MASLAAGSHRVLPGSFTISNGCLTLDGVQSALLADQSSASFNPEPIANMGLDANVPYHFVQKIIISGTPPICIFVIKENMQQRGFFSREGSHYKLASSTSDDTNLNVTVRKMGMIPTFILNSSHMADVRLGVKCALVLQRQPAPRSFTRLATGQDDGFRYCYPDREIRIEATTLPTTLRYLTRTGSTPRIHPAPQGVSSTGNADNHGATKTDLSVGIVPTPDTTARNLPPTRLGTRPSATTLDGSPTRTKNTARGSQDMPPMHLDAPAATSSSSPPPILTGATSPTPPAPVVGGLVKNEGSRPSTRGCCACMST